MENDINLVISYLACRLVTSLLALSRISAWSSNSAASAFFAKANLEIWASQSSSWDLVDRYFTFVFSNWKGRKIWWYVLLTFKYLKRKITHHKFFTTAQYRWMTSNLEEGESLSGFKCWENAFQNKKGWRRKNMYTWWKALLTLSLW